VQKVDSTPKGAKIVYDIELRIYSTARRAFEVPADVQTLGLITGHPGPYCGPFNVLFIGQATCLFGRPETIRIK